MLILLHPAGYRVIITTADGTTMPFTLDPQLFVVLPKPEGSYSVSVQAINSAGLGTVEGVASQCTQTWDLFPGSAGEAGSLLLAVLLHPNLWSFLKALCSEVSI